MSTLKTNREKVVMLSVQGKVAHPKFAGYRVSIDGEPMVIPGTAGITYNVHVGDPAFGWAGDHVEPSVTVKGDNTDENAALAIYSCVGNEARIVTGEAKGAKGYVLGTHGGVEHLIVEFSSEVMEKMTLDDKILIKGWGQGLAAEQFPDIHFMSLDPSLLDVMELSIKDGVLHFPVVAEIPQRLMGSGVGSPYAQRGDYDLLTSEMEEICSLGLDTLRFGDFVLLQDSDNTYGKGGYKKGAVSVGVVIHSDCIKAGHGPGITIVASCKKPLIKAKKMADANLKNYMEKLNRP